MVARRRTHRLGGTPQLLLCLLLGLALLGPTSPSAYAAVPPVSARTTEVVTADALPTAQVNGVVWTTVVVGNRIFAGGEFTRARPPGARAGTSERSRGNLVSVSLSTGALLSFAPKLNGPVRALAVSTDRTTLFVAGSFTRVGSIARNRFAAFRISDGKLLAHRPRFNGTVNALTVSPTAVYAGGSFTVVNGVRRSRLAAVTARAGSLTRWAPSADATVNALVITGDRTKVVAGGSFDRVNTSSGRGLVALDAKTGWRKSWKINAVVKDYGPNAAILSLAADRDTVYGTGYGYGGGNFEGVFAADDTAGDVRWLQDCHGDTYDVAPVGDTIYSVSHAHHCSNIGGFPEFSPRREQRALAVTRTAQGTVAVNSQPGPHYGNFAGQPAPSMINWFPAVNAGRFTGMFQGAWSVSGTADYLVLGGEFTSVDGRAQQGLVRFTLPARKPYARGPEDAGAAPSVSPGAAAGTATVRWPANWDRDEMNIAYHVLRDGAVVGSVTARSTFWNRPTLQFTDPGLHAGTSYRYQIRARHRVDSVTSPATTYPGPAVAQAESAAAAGPTRQLQLGGSVSTATERPTSSLSVELWVKAAAPGGSLVAFGSTPGTAAAPRSRELYLNSLGQLTYAQSRNGRLPLLVQTGSSLADRQWHHVVLTSTRGATVLYVDGLPVGSDTGSPAAGDVGRWWVGGRSPAGLPDSSDRSLSAELEEIAVFDRVLSPGEVHERYGWGRR